MIGLKDFIHESMLCEAKEKYEKEVNSFSGKSKGLAAGIEKYIEQQYGYDDILEFIKSGHDDLKKYVILKTVEHVNGGALGSLTGVIPTMICIYVPDNRELYNDIAKARAAIKSNKILKPGRNINRNGNGPIKKSTPMKFGDALLYFLTSKNSDSKWSRVWMDDFGYAD